MQTIPVEQGFLHVTVTWNRQNFIWRNFEQLFLHMSKVVWDEIYNNPDVNDADRYFYLAIVFIDFMLHFAENRPLVMWDDLQFKYFYSEVPKYVHAKRFQHKQLLFQEWNTIFFKNQSNFWECIWAESHDSSLGRRASIDTKHVGDKILYFF